MATLELSVLTSEREIYSGRVDMVIAPGSLGELGILPNHADLLTSLEYGRMIIRKDGQETELAVGGGFLEIANNKVIVLADAADRIEEIDVARAEEARARAQEALEHAEDEVSIAEAQAALRLSLMRIRIGRRRGGLSDR